MNLYGIWIDHARALVVKADENGEMTVRELESEVPPNSKAGRSDGEHLTMTDQHSMDETRSNELKKFCELILTQLADADEIAVFGPGTAKEDLKRALEEDHDLSPKLKAVETTHPLSEGELKEFVMKIFDLPRE